MGELKGKLLNNLNESLLEFSEEWLKLKVLIQRDGGDKFKVEHIIDSSASSIKKRLVKLVSLVDGSSINKEFSKLINDIKTPGSPWGVEK